MVRAEWCDPASPSVSFLDISPAKAGREFGGVFGSALGSLDGGGGRACEVGGGNHNDPLWLCVAGHKLTITDQQPPRCGGCSLFRGRFPTALISFMRVRYVASTGVTTLYQASNESKTDRNWWNFA
jgi:hypothetical protein